MDDGEHRPEDLLGVERGLQGDVVDDGRAEEVALLVSGDDQGAAVEDDLGALGLGVVDESGDELLGLGVDDRAHLDTLVHAVADLDLLGVGLDAAGQVRSAAAHGHDDGQGHAALAGGAEGGGGDVLGGEVQVGVGHDDGVVVRPAQGLDALAVGDAGVLDDVGHRGGAHEGDRVDAGVLKDLGDHGAVAGDDVEDAVGQAGLLVELGRQQCRRGRGRGRLENEGVAGGDGDGVHPHGHHGREVEGADAGDDADRLAQGVDVHAGGDVEGVLALEGQVDGCGEVEGLAPALDLTDGVGVVLAVLGHDHLGHLVGVVQDQLAHAEHDGGALGQRDLRPLLLGAAGHLDDVVEVGVGGLEQLGLDLTGSRVLDGEAPDRVSLVVLSVNPVRNGSHRYRLLIVGFADPPRLWGG